MMIRLEQMRCLADGCDAGFRKKAMDHLERSFPGKESRELDGLIEEALGRSRMYGFETEWEVIRYLDLLVVLGPAFEDAPRYAAIRAVLEKRELNPRTRITAVYELVHDIGPETVNVPHG